MNLPNPFPNLAVNVAATVQVSTPTTEYKFKKAGTQGTLITMIIDESGSMGMARDATIAGFNEFVAGQKAAEATAGAGYLTLIKFDSPHIKTVYAARPLNEVPVLDHTGYTPNGGTNLLDAIGNAINSVNKVLTEKKKKDRPGVIITIMTDGEENASRSFNNQQIKDMVAAAEKADWTFQFLGANIDAFSVGSTFGMSASNSVNYSTANMLDTFTSVSASTSRMRMAKSAGISTADIYNQGLYTADELKKMK
jgi:uncharacterized protein YegL